MSGVRVLLADDQPLLRHSLAMIIDNEPDLTVAGEAGDGAEAVTCARATRPDVVLMDVRMPRVDGLEATRRICTDRELAATRVLVLSMFELDEYVYAALRAGASGFLLKDTPAERLVDAVRIVAAGDAVVAPSVTRRLLDRFASVLPATTGPATPTVTGLTERERDVLLLVARGLSNAEIAADLVVSETTVKTHVSSVLAKLGLRDRVQAVVYAYESGLVSPH